VRLLLYAAAAIALATMLSPGDARGALAASASALFEATPFLFGGVLLASVLRRRCAFVEIVGCGCGDGFGGRSLPAAAATWMLFGPFVAVARFFAATVAARLLRRRGTAATHDPPIHVLGELRAVLPAAVAAGITAALAAWFDPATLPPAGRALFGAALGFFAAPCGLGAATLAAALRVRAPMAASAFLCVAGIADLRAFARTQHTTSGHDALGYGVLAAALGLVAWRHGGTLVHPAFTLALAGCAIAALVLAALHRAQRCSATRIAPAIMLAGALLGAPAPRYDATETTLTDLFAGERLAFTGELARDRVSAAIVRYAITCCRADASPICVRLAKPPGYAAGTWLHVDGTIENVRGELQLRALRIVRVAAPSDPFVYR